MVYLNGRVFGIQPRVTRRGVVLWVLVQMCLPCWAIAHQEADQPVPKFRS
jgi:hypothetical protein